MQVAVAGYEIGSEGLPQRRARLSRWEDSHGSRDLNGASLQQLPNTYRSLDEPGLKDREGVLHLNKELKFPFTVFLASQIPGHIAEQTRAFFVPRHTWVHLQVAMSWPVSAH